MNKATFALALVAGLLGGAVSNYLRLQPAYAQSQPPAEIRAQRFTLVNQDGITLGSFSYDDLGRPQILLRDRSGHEVWSVVGDHTFQAGRLQPK